MNRNLERRVERLENAAERKREGLPAVLFSLIRPIRDENEALIGEECGGYWRIAPGEPQKWFDENMAPVPRPA